MATTREIRRLRERVEQEIERHESAEDLDAFEDFRNDPVGFIRDVLGEDPWSAQVEIAESVRDNPKTVCRSGHGCGKDWIGSRLALWWVVARQGIALLTAPTERQTIGIQMKEVRRAWRKNASLPGELLTSTLRIGGEDRLVAFTSNSVDAMTGFHDASVLVVISEGQGAKVEDIAYDAADACAQSAESRQLVLGNPVRPMGRFHSINRSDQWNAIPLSCLAHPNITEGEEVIPGGPSLEWLEGVRLEYGEASDWWLSRVCGQFPDTGINQLISRGDIDRAVERWRELEEQGWTGPEMWSLDVAHRGADFTSLARAYSVGVRSVEKWNGLEFGESADRVEERRGENKRAPTVVDVGGIGIGFEEIARGRNWTVLPFNGSQQARRHDKFHNARAEAGWAIRQALRGGWALPDDEELHEDLLCLEWAEDPQGRIQLAGKDDIRAMLKRSPDKGDSVMMAAYFRGKATPMVAPESVGVRTSIWGMDPGAEWARTSWSI